METRCLCNNCKQVIVMPNIKFDMMNDYGWILVTCNKCNKELLIPSINPDETYPISGARKLESFDDEIYTLSEIQNNHPNASLINEQINAQLPLSKKAPYSYSKPSIHHCNNCGESLDELAKNELKNEESNLVKEYYEVMNCILAEQGYAKQAIFRIDTSCKCGKNVQLFFAKRFKADGAALKIDDLDFISTNQEIKASNINTLASKSDCLSILGKFIARWNNIADQIVLVTPFIGNQYLNAEKLANEWKWLFDRTAPQKTRLITRSSTLKQFKNKYPDLGIDEEIWKKYDLEETTIKNMKKKTK